MYDMYVPLSYYY